MFATLTVFLKFIFEQSQHMTTTVRKQRSPRFSRSGSYNVPCCECLQQVHLHKRLIKLIDVPEQTIFKTEFIEFDAYFLQLLVNIHYQ